MTASEAVAPLRKLSRSSSEPRWTSAPRAAKDFAPASERAMPRTLCPAEISSFTVGVPIKPVAPVTKIRKLKLLFWFTDCVKVGKYFRRNLQRRSLEILPKMLAGRCSRNQQNVGRALQKPRQSNLHRRRAETRGDIRQLCRLQWREPAERKERHVRNPVASELVDERVIGSMHEVVVILYTDNRDNS